MPSPKNTKPLDLSAVRDFVEQSGGPAFGALAPIGTTTRPPIELLQPVEPITFEQVWRQMPTELWWELLKQRRVASLCPDDDKPEWERYYELLRRSGPPQRGEIFVGLECDLNDKKKCRPVLVSRKVFEHHAYILGLPGTGKTSQALAQLLLQLADDHVDSDGQQQPHPPLLIIDLKEGGDNYLRGLAEFIASKRKQTLQFFSNDPDFESLQFDPYYNLNAIQYPLKKGETILKALSLIYKEGYGSDFFTAEQHTELLRILYKDNPKTLLQLIQFVDRDTRGSKKNKDARGLYSALAPLQYSFHLVKDDRRPAAERLLDLNRFYEKREVLYIHLNSRSQSIDAKVIGKLVVFLLMEIAAERKKRGGARQVFVAIDEFQRLAAQNIVEVLEDSRSLKVGFILSHQSPESLRTRETDLYRMIADLCSYKQFLSLTSSNIIEQLQLVSGRRFEEREGRSEGTTKGESHSTGTTHGNSTTDGKSKANTWGFFTPSTTTVGQSHSTGKSFSESRSSSDSEASTETRNWRQEAVAGLTPEAIAAVNGTPLLALIHVHEADPNPYMTLGGLPTLVRGLFPFSSKQAKDMGQTRWPAKTVETDVFIEGDRAHIPAGAISEYQPKKKKKRSQPGQTSGSGSADTSKKEIKDHKERRELRRRIRLLAEGLIDHMLPEAWTLQALSKGRATFPQIISLAALHGVTVSEADDVIPARVVRAILPHLPKKESPTEQPEKDNGPP